MNTEQIYMALALDQAKKGNHQDWANPLVGCVIVKNNQVIGKGYNQAFKHQHALINAVKRLNKEQIKDSDVYLTFEPCDTCAKLITNLGVNHIYIAQTNPNPRFKNKNSTRIALKSKQTTVTTGILRDEANKINSHYSYFCQNDDPWITLKQNLSLDHNVSPANGKYIKLTNPKVKDYIRHERSNYQAILIGSSTAIIDNPTLDTDDESESEPIRVVIDRRGRLLNNPGLNLLNSNKYDTWIISQNSNMRSLESKHVRVFLQESNNLKPVIDFLADSGIRSIYVEGGPTLEKSFMDEAYANEIIDYFSPVYFGNIGISGAVPIHQLDLDDVNVQKIDDHIRIAGRIK